MNFFEKVIDMMTPQVKNTVCDHAKCISPEEYKLAKHKIYELLKSYASRINSLEDKLSKKSTRDKKLNNKQPE